MTQSHEPIERDRGATVVARSDVGIDERRPQRHGGDAGGIDLAQRPREHTDREVRLAPLEMGGGERECCLDVAVEAVQKLFGFLEAALSNPQVGEAHEGTRPKRAVSETPDPHGVAQRHVGFAPSAGGGEQPAVVRSTERCHGRQVSTGGDVLTDPDPLIGPVDVMRVLARREELAEDLLDHREVIDIASGHCRQGLVEEQHAFIDAVVVDEARAEIRERGELERRVAGLACVREGVSVVLFLDDSVRLEHPLVERHPPGLRARSFLGEQ